MVAYRLPRDLSIVTPRSYCESCERALPWWANIPILAYLGLRGRCVMCGAPIPFRHFLAEIGLAFIALYLYFAFPIARRDRALRAVRRAVDHRDHRLRLAADSEHHHLARHAGRIHCRVDDDARGRLEKFAASEFCSAAACCSAPAIFTSWCADARASGWATCGCSGWWEDFSAGREFSSRCFSVRYSARWAESHLRSRAAARLHPLRSASRRPIRRKRTFRF